MPQYQNKSGGWSWAGKSYQNFRAGVGYMASLLGSATAAEGIVNIIFGLMETQAPPHSNFFNYPLMVGGGVYLTFTGYYLVKDATAHKRRIDRLEAILNRPLEGKDYDEMFD